MGMNTQTRKTFEDMPGMYLLEDSWSRKWMGSCTAHFIDEEKDYDPQIATIYALPFTKETFEGIYVPKGLEEYRDRRDGFAAVTSCYPDANSWGPTEEEAIRPLYIRYRSMRPVYALWARIAKLKSMADKVWEKKRELGKSAYLVSTLTDVSYKELWDIGEDLGKQATELWAEKRKLEVKLFEAAGRGGLLLQEDPETCDHTWERIFSKGHHECIHCDSVRTFEPGELKENGKVRGNE